MSCSREHRRRTVRSWAMLPLLITSLALFLSAVARAANNVDHVAAAKAAERSFHAACDEWSAAEAKGEETSSAAAKITGSYFDFMKHIMRTKYIPNAALLVPPVPVSIVGAGKLGLSDGSTASYVVHSGGGLVMITWDRAAWTDHKLPSHGFAASLRIESPELCAKFTAGKADWADTQKKVLRVPYTLGEVKGVIEIRCGGKDYPWPIHPDRGVVKGGWWQPFRNE